MNLVEFIPKGRTSIDKKAYVFINWFFRKHKKIFKKLMDKNIENYFLYGKELDKNEIQKEIEKELNESKKG